ncbi:uncharacterized protein [Rutidosis leptorrhynchoides]|uniref:uncharacterized protein isoform X1 n=1 Tax=Rutidosis leptorrhynchoides TaxID=125765 RepID=UPI003A9990E3
MTKNFIINQVLKDIYFPSISCYTDATKDSRASNENPRGQDFASYWEQLHDYRGNRSRFCLITPPLRVVKNGRNSQTYMVRRKTFFLPHHSSAQRFMSMEKHKTTLDLKSVVDRNVEACPPVKEDENPTLDLISILEGEGITLLNVIEALNPHLNTPEMQRVTLLIRSSKEKDIPKSEVVMKIQQIVGESLMSDVVTRLWKKLLKVAS